MEYISLPRSSLGSRWRPAGGAPLQAWRPAPTRLSAPPVQSHELGQINPLAVADVGISMLTALGTTMVGFGLAIWGPKDAPTWRWIGGLAGSIGAMRMLHDVSKLGI